MQIHDEPDYKPTWRAYLSYVIKRISDLFIDSFVRYCCLAKDDGEENSAPILKMWKTEGWIATNPIIVPLVPFWRVLQRGTKRRNLLWQSYKTPNVITIALYMLSIYAKAEGCVCVFEEKEWR